MFLDREVGLELVYLCYGVFTIIIDRCIALRSTSVKQLLAGEKGFEPYWLLMSMSRFI
jgi:hypothetical protein